MCLIFVVLLLSVMQLGGRGLVVDVVWGLGADRRGGLTVVVPFERSMVAL